MVLNALIIALINAACFCKNFCNFSCFSQRFGTNSATHNNPTIQKEAKVIGSRFLTMESLPSWIFSRIRVAKKLICNRYRKRCVEAKLRKIMNNICRAKCWIKKITEQSKKFATMLGSRQEARANKFFSVLFAWLKSSPAESENSFLQKNL